MNLYSLKFILFLLPIDIGQYHCKVPNDRIIFNNMSAVLHIRRFLYAGSVCPIVMALDPTVGTNCMKL